MIPYLILVLCPTIIWMLNDKVCFISGNRLVHKTKSLSLDVFMLIFLLLLAFRGLQCGNDTVQYLRLFEKYSSKNFVALFANDTHEIGYKLLNKLIGSITDNYQFLLIITAFFCVCPIWYFYKRESEIPLLTIALFLSVAPFVMFFSGIRQSIAMSIGSFAWYAAKSKKVWLFILVILLAMQFHSSAIVLLAIYPLYYARVTKKWLWFVTPCMILIYFSRNLIFNFLFDFLWKEYEKTAETGAVNVLILLIMFAVYSYIMVDEGSLDQDTIALRNLLLLSVVIQIFAMLHPLSMRMNYYFLLFVPIMIPKIATKCKKEFAIIGKISIVVMIVYFLYYFVVTVVTDNDPLNTYPYIPFWKNG